MCRWLLVLFAAQFPWLVLAQEEDSTSPLRDVIHTRLSETQACLEVEDNACAERILDELQTRTDLSPYETGRVQNFRAVIHRSRGEIAQAIPIYESIVALPDLPPAFEGAILSSLAELLHVEGRHHEALEAVVASLPLLPHDETLNELADRISVAIESRDQVSSLEELQRIVDEIADAVASTYACTLTTSTERFSFFTGESVYYSLAGRNCEPALQLMNDRGARWKIVFRPERRFTQPRPYDYQEPRKPRNFDLIHQIIE